MNKYLRTLFDRRFWLFFGSGLIVSVAYIDPGNWGTSISAGSKFGYSLLWVIWLSSLMAMLFQYLSGKLGIAGYSLAEIIKIKWKNKKAVFVYWILAEFSILATDIAEFLGIVVALNLLFGIPLMFGTFIAIVDVILLIIFMQRSFRILEYSFMFFVSIIGLSYLYEMVIMKPNVSEILIYSIRPEISSSTIALIIGMIGATVMPHALFIHSWLLKRKMKSEKRSIALRYHLVENIGSLTLAALINAAILIMAAVSFFNVKEVVSIKEAYLTLEPLYGKISSLIFGIALLSAGISSSITGMLSGQSIMEALTDFKISPILRRLITRIINAIPLLIAILLNIEPLEILVYSQVILSLLIPLPLIPLIYYTSKRDVMKELVNSKITTIISSTFALLIIILNLYFVFDFLLGLKIIS